jgi:uncharacterized membrane protein YecN with MAPEG domain
MISSLYSSLLALIFIILTVRVIRLRRSQKISIGDGGNFALQKAIAAQANFCQSCPIFLILFLITEFNDVNSIILHCCGVIMLLGRALHAYGINQEKENFFFRVGGMIATFTALIILISINLLLYFLAF